MRRALGTAVVSLALLAVLASEAGAAGLVDHVRPLAGTRPGPDTFGGGHNFPGATVPFGMVQFGPDTTPADRNGRAGYDYRDNHLRGFSLTHLSGAGCSLYGDFPLVPTTEPLRSSPARAGTSQLAGGLQPGFSHAGERAHPGYYALHLNPVGGPGIDAEMTATTRTGVGRFTFGRNPHASILLNAGGSAQADDLAAVHVDPARREIDGTASSGLFCGQRPRYRVYVAAVFDRPFEAYGTWQRQRLEPESTDASDTREPIANPPTTAQAGAYATFDTRRNRQVSVHVGVSFVSVADARANLAAEDPHASFGTVARRAERSWNRSLGRIRVEGGPPRLLDTFYTALYHAFLAPRTFSDVGGAYPGMDGLVHRAPAGHIQYADFSGWDVYRGEIQLLSLLVPERASDMARSLLADADQSGCLPRWPYANGQSMTMVGDSADPILASAAAFGAHFDTASALAAMVRGATGACESANGEYVERQGLAEYLRLGYVPFDLDSQVRNANSIYGEPDAVWGSAATTLEYAVDDFAIARLAARTGDRGLYGSFMSRSANWRNLYDPASGLIEPRYASGAFPSSYSGRHGGGFVEGDAVQYSWMVPQDPAGLIARMGGPGKAAARLDRFLRELNGGAGGTHSDHALLGDEPTLGTPWLYDWMRRPYRTQSEVRRALLSLYDTSPDGYPGNDDLGTLSAWYVFGALGLYPPTPGVGLLAIGSPLFGRARIALAHRRRATILATAYRTERVPAGKHGRRAISRRVALSPSAAPYVRSLRLDGHAYGRPWISYCALARGASLDFALGRGPSRGWGAAGAAAPPSSGPRAKMPRSACAP